MVLVLYPDPLVVYCVINLGARLDFQHLNYVVDHKPEETTRLLLIVYGIYFIRLLSLGMFHRVSVKTEMTSLFTSYSLAHTSLRSHK